MVTGVKITTDEIMKKPYWSFSEIIEIAIKYQFMKRDNDHDDVLNFEIKLITDMKTAIDCKDIIPVDLEKIESWIDKHKIYIKPVLLNGGVLLLISLLFLLKYIWDKPEMKEAIVRDGGSTDFSLILLGFCKMVVVIALPVFAIVFHRVLKRLILKFRGKSPHEMINYLLEDANVRGYTKNQFVRESVIDFLNTSYNLGIGRGQKTESPIMPEAQGAAEEQHSPETNEPSESVNISAQEAVPEETPESEEQILKDSRRKDARWNKRDKIVDGAAQFMKSLVDGCHCLCRHDKLADIAYEFGNNDESYADLDEDRYNLRNRFRAAALEIVPEERQYGNDHDPNKLKKYNPDACNCEIEEHKKFKPKKN